MQKAINTYTEASDASFHLTRTSLYSFIKNNPWFSGTVFLLTHQAAPLSTKNYETLLSIYPNLSVKAEESHPIFKAIDRYKNKPQYLDLLSAAIKWTVFSELSPNERSIYFSNHIVFQRSCEFMLTEKINKPSNTASFFHLQEKIIIPQEIYDALSNKILTSLSLDDSLNHYLNSEFDPTFYSTANFSFSSDYPNSKFVTARSSLQNKTAIFFNTLNSSVQYSKINQLWLFKNKESSQFLNSPLAFAKESKEHTSSQQNNSEAFDSQHKISYIIPAYAAQNYIAECLNSIVSQTVSSNYEILVGVDGCRATLDKLLQIKDSYKNLSIYYSDKRVGPYVIKNSLVNYSKHPNIFFFDADDVLGKDSMRIILKNYSSQNIVRFKYSDFKSSYKTQLKISSIVSHGSFLINKSVFDKIGGFQAWSCAADTEFLKRCENNSIKTVNINSSLFYRRIHQASLTQDSKTKYNSTVRNNYQNWIEKNKDWKIPIHRVTTNFISVDKSNEKNKFITKECKYEHDSEIIVTIFSYDRANFLKKVVAQIREQSPTCKIRVIDDCSPNINEYSELHDMYGFEWVRNTYNLGKIRFWENVNTSFNLIKNDKSFKYYIFIQDDVILKSNFFEDSIFTWNNIIDNQKICLSLLMDEFRRGKVNWTNFKPKDLGEVYLTQWNDMFFICTVDFFKKLNYKINAIPLARWKNNPLLSSGVGEQISHRLFNQKLNMYHVKNTFVYHGNHDSKMNTNARKITPLITNHVN